MLPILVTDMGWDHPGPWIGLQDKDLDAVFEWNDGTELFYTNWCTTSPTAAGSREYVNMELTTSDSPCWGDNGSSTTVALDYVCEFALNNPPEAAEISIDPHEPVEGEDDLICILDTESDDTDGDSISYTFEFLPSNAAYPLRWRLQ